MEGQVQTASVLNVDEEKGKKAESEIMRQYRKVGFAKTIYEEVRSPGRFDQIKVDAPHRLLKDMMETKVLFDHYRESYQDLLSSKNLFDNNVKAKNVEYYFDKVLLKTRLE